MRKFWPGWSRFGIATGILAGGVLIALVTGPGFADSKKKMMVIGFDGMDPKQLQQHIDNGYMPNFKRLIEKGSFTTLGTSIPPQSPVAWSNFISGKNPGGHNIFDFIHRDPKTYLPFLSTSEAVGSSKSIELWGDWQLPLGGGEVVLLREGRAFWELLEKAEVPTTIFKIPANYPPVQTNVRTLSGMGTPDMQGTPGTFTYFTTHPPENADDISGGAVVDIYFDRDKSEASIPGPPNPFHKKGKETGAKVTMYRDKENQVAKIVTGDEEVIMKPGEFSEWVPVEFYMLGDEGFGDKIRPAAAPMGLAIGGSVRFYLKSVYPEFSLYVTPVQIDPLKPAQPVSTPDDWSQKIAERTGRFYTQGMPEDTKALEGGVFTDGEFLQQATLVLDERMKLFETMVSDFAQDEWGFLFFYFSSLDQQTHVMWRTMDPSHPGTDSLALQYPDAIPSIFRRLDKAVGVAMDQLGDDATLVIMSDHGFAPWYREVHLNSWLADNGYLTLKDNSESVRASSDFFMNVDWRRTKAYALGINGLYINVRGREKNGTVAPGKERDDLMNELIAKMKELRDPKTGELAIKEVYKSEEVFQGPYVKNAPDLNVGYAYTFRGSNESALGEFPMEWFADNTGKWSGDHCIAADLVPGILISNRKVKKEGAALYDLTATILAEFGVDKDEDMIGSPVF